MKKRRAKARKWWFNRPSEDSERIAHLRRTGRYIPPEKPSIIKRLRIRLIEPLKWVETKFIEPVAQWVNNADLFNILEKMGFLFAAIIFITEFSDRREKTIFEAWNVVNDGEGEKSGVVKMALERLHYEKFSLSGIDASETNLEVANLEMANLLGANLKKANLWSANLKKADLRYANLGEARLWNANLGGADLSNANLKGADLKGAYLNGAKFCKTTMPDGKKNNTGCSRDD
jgi:hypothetical protein